LWLGIGEGIQASGLPDLFDLPCAHSVPLCPRQVLS
jgi:hypothetical protein